MGSYTTSPSLPMPFSRVSLPEEMALTVTCAHTSCQSMEACVWWLLSAVVTGFVYVCSSALVACICTELKSFSARQAAYQNGLRGACEHACGQLHTTSQLGGRPEAGHHLRLKQI